MTPSYFETMGIEVVEGRALEAGDAAEAPRIVVVNETFARRHYPDGRAVGQRVAFGPSRDDATWRLIVGIAEDIKGFGVATDSRETIYFPYDQVPTGFMSLVVRTSIEPSAAIGSIRREIAAIDRQLAAETVLTMREVV